jgi:hypothetical protein
MFLTFNNLHIDIENGGRLNTNGVTLLFQYSTPHSAVSIFQQHQHMGFTVRNLFGNLWFVPCTVIFWADLSCWGKRCCNKSTEAVCLRGPYNTMAKRKRTKGQITIYKKYIENKRPRHKNLNKYREFTAYIYLMPPSS